MRLDNNLMIIMLVVQTIFLMGIVMKHPNVFTLAVAQFISILLANVADNDNLKIPLIIVNLIFAMTVLVSVQGC